MGAESLLSVGARCLAACRLAMRDVGGPMQATAVGSAGARIVDVSALSRRIDALMMEQ